jgi:hypothetical protein
MDCIVCCSFNHNLMGREYFVARALVLVDLERLSFKSLVSVKNVESLQHL